MDAQQSFEFWKERLTVLRTEGSKFAEPLLWHVSQGIAVIGFGSGQLRPGELGQFDFYYFCLQAGFGPPKAAAQAARLDYDRIRQEENAASNRHEQFWRDLSFNIQN